MGSLSQEGPIEFCSVTLPPNINHSHDTNTIDLFCLFLVFRQIEIYVHTQDIMSGFIFSILYLRDTVILSYVLMIHSFFIV